MLFQPAQQNGWIQQQQQQQVAIVHIKQKREVDHCQHACCCFLCLGAWLPCWVAASMGYCCEKPFEEVCDCG